MIHVIISYIFLYFPISYNFVSDNATSGKVMTRLEKARLEALKSFGGNGLDDVLSSSSRRVARTLKQKSEKKMEKIIKKNETKENTPA